jgi:hypothetical protein
MCSVFTSTSSPLAPGPSTTPEPFRPGRSRGFAALWLGTFALTQAGFAAEFDRMPDGLKSAGEWQCLDLLHSIQPQ